MSLSSDTVSIVSIVLTVGEALGGVVAGSVGTPVGIGVLVGVAVTTAASVAGAVAGWLVLAQPMPHKIESVNVKMNILIFACMMPSPCVINVLILTFY